ncbi:MAG: ferrous iron transporter B [Candidatus Zixiibacteriota bacterium]|nr:MAG: ferrous iron transporter B [candidate division Zixibacteria bacterium]
MRKILLIGNPNVGKSVIFSRLTGVNVIASNYPGTTVEYTRGQMKLRDEEVEIIDVPGTYDLDPTSPAEEVAVQMAREGDVIIDVVDATNLERNLNLTLQLLKDGKPVVIALNLWDETRHIGISIDVDRLQNILGVPVIPTCAITGEGIKELVSELPQAKANSFHYDQEKRWEKVGEIVSQVQKITHRHHTFLERLEDLSIKPATALPLALVSLVVIFSAIRFIGEGLIGVVFEPAFERLWAPLMMQLSKLLGAGFLHDVLIGRLVEGQIDFVESLGLLTTGLFVPIAAVLPYVLAFYLVLSLLEDSGYLPRLAVLVDSVMHRLGLHGLAIIPMMLGLGCNVPGAMATRVLQTRRERFLAATLMAIAVPCAAQTAMVVGLVGRHGATGLGLVFGTLLVVWLTLGFLLNRFTKGESPEIFVEIPPYRMPYWGALLKKLSMRVKGFIRGAVPFVLLGVLITNILYSLGIIQFIGRLAAPIITGVLGLPEDAVGALIIGFLRKDVAVGMLLPLGLDLRQMVVASVVLTMYFPCVAAFAVLVRELGVKDMMKSAAIMISSALIVGGLLNLIL